MKPPILTHRDLEIILRYTNGAETEVPPGMLDGINRQLDLYAFARILESPDRKAEKDWLIENGRQLKRCGQKLLLRDDDGGSYLIHFLERAAVQHAETHGPPLEIGIDQAIDHNNASYCVDRVINSIMLFSKWCNIIGNDLEGEDWMTNLLFNTQPEVRLIGSHLPALYEKYLGKRFGASVSAGGTGPGGPGTRFIVGVLNHAEIKNQNGQPYSAGRYVRSGLRARAISVEYVLSLGVGSAVVPLIAGMHHIGLGFDIQFLGLAVSASVVLVAAWFLPRSGAQHSVSRLKAAE